MITLATDFDGTIFFMRETPSFHEKDLQAIKEFQKHNKLGLCSGRPITSVTMFTDNYFKFDFMIASTGSFICDREGNVLLDKPIEKEIAKQLIKEYEDSHEIYLHLNQVFATYKIALDEGPIKENVIHKVDELDQYKTYQVTIVAKTLDEAKQICKSINNKYPLNAFQNQTFIDIVWNECSKGKGIEFIKNYYGVDKISGIGDSQNDMPMFKVCDTSFTFSDSPKEVKETTTHIVDYFYEAVELLMKGEE